MIYFVPPGSDIPALDCCCFMTCSQCHRTVTHIFRRYGISGNVDGLKCSSMFLKDASSPLALQTSKAWTHTGKATEKQSEKEIKWAEISNQLKKVIIKCQKSNQPILSSSFSKQNNPKALTQFNSKTKKLVQNHRLINTWLFILKKKFHWVVWHLCIFFFQGE